MSARRLTEDAEPRPPVGRGDAGADVYRAHWESAGEGLFSVRVLASGDFVFEGINPLLQCTSGLCEAAFVGRRPDEVLEPEGAAWVVAHYRKCLERGERISYFETLNLPVGRKRWKTVLTPVRDERGRITRLLGTAHPVAATVPSPRNLQRARRHYQAAIDLSPSQVAVLDASGAVVQVNVAWRRFGRDNGATEHGIGRNYLEVCDASASAAPEAGLVARDLRAMLAGRIETFLSLPYECAGAHFIVRATRIELAGASHIVMAHQDVSELYELQSELRATTERLLNLQEEERARIGLELHDSVSQHLTAIGLGVSTLRRRLGASEVLDDMRLAVSEAHREIRSLTYLLHPPQLARDGLAATLHTFVEGFRRRTELGVELVTCGRLEDLPSDIQRAVFRVVQEALGNVLRHANATQARVVVALSARGLRVRIVDDGWTPFDERSPARGVGIPGMAARIRQFGGRLDVRRRAVGTCVRAVVPRLGLGANRPGVRAQPPGAA